MFGNSYREDFEAKGGFLVFPFAQVAIRFRSGFVRFWFGQGTFAGVVVIVESCFVQERRA